MTGLTCCVCWSRLNLEWDESTCGLLKSSTENWSLGLPWRSTLARSWGNWCCKVGSNKRPCVSNVSLESDVSKGSVEMSMGRGRMIRGTWFCGCDNDIGGCDRDACGCDCDREPSSSRVEGTLKEPSVLAGLLRGLREDADEVWRREDPPVWGKVGARGGSIWRPDRSCPHTHRSPGPPRGRRQNTHTVTHTHTYTLTFHVEGSVGF